MDQLMAENFASATAEGAAAFSHPPPPTHRRPRVREVSSRFMSPVAASSGDLSHAFPTRSPLPKHHQAVSTPTPNLAEIQSRQRSSSVNRPRRHLDLEPWRCSDENIPTRPSSMESPLPPDQALNTRKQRPFNVNVNVKPLKENGGGKPQPQHLPKTCSTAKGSNAFTTLSRSDTPMVTASLDRTPSSRFRLIQQRSTNVSASAAARLLQSSQMSLPAPPTTNLVSEANIQEATSAPVPDLSSQNPHANDSNHTQIPSVPSCTRRCLPDIRSSMPEADMLPIVSTRQMIEKTCNRANTTVSGSDFSKLPASASPCSRSLNLPLSSSEHLLFQSIKGSEKLASAFSKPCTNAVKMGGLCLPPVPPCASARPGLEIRKGKKVSSLREDAHSLRLLQNRYLQWRYANATAEASMLAQQRETEVSCCSPLWHIIFE